MLKPDIREQSPIFMHAQIPKDFFKHNEASLYIFCIGYLVIPVDLFLFTVWHLHEDIKLFELICFKTSYFW